MSITALYLPWASISGSLETWNTDFITDELIDRHWSSLHILKTFHYKPAALFHCPPPQNHHYTGGNLSELKQKRGTWRAELWNWSSLEAPPLPARALRISSIPSSWPLSSAASTNLLQAGQPSLWSNSQRSKAHDVCHETLHTSVHNSFLKDQWGFHAVWDERLFIDVHETLLGKVANAWLNKY